MPTTLALPAERLPALPQQTMRDYHQLARYLVLLAAVVALIGKLLIAWTTFGTNDVASFYQFGKLLEQHGLEWTYLSSVAFNHPPLVAAFIQHIYEWDHIPWLHENGVAFPFLLRLPGIVADFIVVLVLLSASRPLRLPTWSLLLLALSPVSLMVSGFHGNTDPVMVMFLMLAALMCLRKRPILCGLFLALSCQIKIIPLLLVPIFLFYWLHRRRTIAFLFPFAASMILLWIQPLLEFPAIFIHRVLFYGSFWGLWGITYWLRMTGVTDFAPVTYYNFLPLQQVVVTVLKLAIIAAVLAIGWSRRKLEAYDLFASLGWAWVIFFIFSPGVCAQYMVWLMPFVLVLSPGLFASLTAASSLFLFFFYNAIAGGLPWYLAISTGQLNDRWLPWSLWPWAILISGAVLLWRNAARATPDLPFCSSASINPPRPL
jgi:Glycosyltransferase family 87